jgi:hypothetical protein
VEVSQVASLNSPHQADLHFIHRWLTGLKDGEGNSFLRGTERNTWNEKLGLDEFLVVDVVRGETDATTGRLVDNIITLFNKLVGRRIKARLFSISCLTSLDIGLSFLIFICFNRTQTSKGA